MKKQRVLFVYHSLHIGGAEKEMLAYISCLDKTKYSVHLALTKIEGELLTDVPAGASLHNVMGDSFKPDIKYLYNLYKIITTIKPSIVVGFMQDISFNILLIRALSHNSYKVIISEQIVLSQWQKVKKTSWLKKMLISILYRQANAIAGQAAPILRDLKQNFGIEREKLFLVPNFITKRDFDAKSPLIQRSTNASPYFLYVGRLAPEKNIELLLRAFAITSAHGSRPELIIAGPFDNSYFQEICSTLGILRTVKFVGYVSDPQPYYRSAIALIIPSFVEGRSRVMIEAMLAHCPVICSDFVGHADYIRDNIDGMIFIQNSTKSLANKMQIALQRPKHLKRLARNAYQTIQKHFPNDYVPNYAKKVDQLFDTVLNA